MAIVGPMVIIIAATAVTVLRPVYRHPPLLGISSIAFSILEAVSMSRQWIKWDWTAISEFVDLNVTCMPGKGVSIVGFRLGISSEVGSNDCYWFFLRTVGWFC